MTIVDSRVSMQTGEGGVSNANNIVNVCVSNANNIVNVSSSNPTQIPRCGTFQPQRFISLDINSYQKLVNSTRPTNSFLTLQPASLQQLLPLPNNTSNPNVPQYVHVQLPTIQQGANFIQLPSAPAHVANIAQTQVANIAPNVNGLDALQNLKQTVASVSATSNASQLQGIPPQRRQQQRGIPLQQQQQRGIPLQRQQQQQGIPPQRFSIQLLPTVQTCQNQSITCNSQNAKPVIGTPLHPSNSLSIRPVIISPIVTMGQTIISTNTTMSCSGSIMQTAPMRSVNYSSKESVSKLVQIHPAPITASDMLVKAPVTSSTSPKSIKILPSAVSSTSSSLFKALQDVANTPVKSPITTRFPLNNMQTILTGMKPNPMVPPPQKLNIQQHNVNSLVKQNNVLPPKLISENNQQQTGMLIGPSNTMKTDDHTLKGFQGTVMMVNPGQPLNNKQQLIIPKAIPSNQGGMPMFVPITMATNNVSVLTNQGSAPGDQTARFGPATTLRIQSQIGAQQQSSSCPPPTCTSGSNIVLNPPTNQKILVPVRSLDSIAPRIATSVASTTSASSVTINPVNQKILIPFQPTSVQQQYVLQTVAHNLLTFTGTNLQVAQHQPTDGKTENQFIHQLQQQQLQLQQPDQQNEQQERLTQQHNNISVLESPPPKPLQLPDPQQRLTTKFLHSQQHLQEIRQQQQEQRGSGVVQNPQEDRQQQQLEINLSRGNNSVGEDTQVPIVIVKSSSTKWQSLTSSITDSKPLKKPLTSSITDSKPLKKPCNCTKSQCLKLYCECFANGEFCSTCNCRQCLNNINHELERSKAIKTCLERNPYAFHPKIGKGKVKGDNERRHTKGCNCKRSGCLKNYCECYEAKILCSSLCKCSGCKNFEESADRKTLMHLADAAEVRVLQQNAAKTKLASQINIVQKKPCIPGKEKLPFNFMTEDVSKATCGILMTCISDAEMMMETEEAEKVSDVEMEESVIEEFSRCLNQIIEKSVNFKKGRKR